MTARTERARRRATTFALAALLLAAGATAAAAGPRTVADGVEFAYYAPGAGKIVLAGDFNGWNADQLRLTDDGKGNWTVVVKLAPGKHLYKFVVDGGWFADPENPNSEPDPYGGANSVVTIGADGKVVETAPARPLSNTPLNARVFVAGRYLTRLEARKNVDDDPRYRLARPSQQVDLNFHTTVSDNVEAYTRLRLDNEQNIILNNVSGYLDEASLDVHPAPVHVVGYRNRELLQLGDPLSLGGDVDLPGTILDDHLQAGKGTAGVTVEASPFGARLQGYFADVYDADTYNDPDLFDDTGYDLIGLRLSRRVGGLEFGLPFQARRGLVWLDLTPVLSLPGGTGLPRFDRWRDESGDDSIWHEFEDLDLRAGLDVTRRWHDGRGVASLEVLGGSRRQGFVTGDNAGLNQDNGRIDAPILDRSTVTLHGSLDLDLGGAHHLNVEHTWTAETGADADENEFTLAFLPQTVANKHIFFVAGASPPEVSNHYSEATWSWRTERREHLVWLQRFGATADFTGTGGPAPADTTALKPRLTTWILAGRSAVGKPEDRWGRWELEHGLAFTDNDALASDLTQVEFILRGERRLAPGLFALCDVRFVNYNADLSAAATGGDPIDDHFDFWAPYGGLRYLPNPRVEVVVAYGVDPLDFDIDYQGRRIGRERFRARQYFGGTASGVFDPERALDDARVLGVRAQFVF